MILCVPSILQENASKREREVRVSNTCYILIAFGYKTIERWHYSPTTPTVTNSKNILGPDLALGPGEPTGRRFGASGAAPLEN